MFFMSLLAFVSLSCAVQKLKALFLSKGFNFQENSNDCSSHLVLR